MSISFPENTQQPGPDPVDGRTESGSQADPSAPGYGAAPQYSASGQPMSGQTTTGQDGFGGAVPAPTTGSGTAAPGMGKAIGALALSVASVVGLIVPLFFDYIWPYPGLILAFLGMSLGKKSFDEARTAPGAHRLLPILAMVANGIMLVISILILIYVMATK